MLADVSLKTSKRRGEMFFQHIVLLGFSNTKTNAMSQSKSKDHQNLQFPSLGH